MEIEKIIAMNETNFPDANWIKKNQIGEMESIRKELISEFEKLGGKTAYNRTKYYTQSISPGCKNCGDGVWSCLFINNICNANCFYCPTTQLKKDIPTTNTLSFPKIKDYLSYLQLGQFSGFSISGGEPFLSYERSLEFLKAIHNRFDNDIYKWLYTNGILLTKALAKGLQKAGLNELRFDLSAINYDLEPLKIAIDYIEHVTVEIPAIPEDEEKVKQLLKTLKKMGISYLNLHQIRATTHNFQNLKKRNYTFLHGKQVTVLESELTAFRLMNYNLKNQIDLPINYCSFTYKNRFQNKANRSRLAALWNEPLKEITENGYIRTILLTDIEQTEQELLSFEPEGNNWMYKKSSLQISRNMIFNLKEKNVQLEYASVHLVNSPTYHFPFQEIAISSRRKIYLEKRTNETFTLLGEDAQKLLSDDFFNKVSSNVQHNHSGNIAAYECTANELLPYY